MSNMAVSRSIKQELDKLAEALDASCEAAEAHLATLDGYCLRTGDPKQDDPWLAAGHTLEDSSQYLTVTAINNFTECHTIDELGAALDQCGDPESTAHDIACGAYWNKLLDASAAHHHELYHARPTTAAHALRMCGETLARRKVWALDDLDPDLSAREHCDAVHAYFRAQGDHRLWVWRHRDSRRSESIRARQLEMRALRTAAANKKKEVWP